MRGQVSRTPAARSASNRNAGTIAGGPPKSAPIVGEPMRKVATSPTTAMIPAASRRRPARTNGLVTAMSMRIVAEAKIENAVLLNP